MEASPVLSPKSEGAALTSEVPDEEMDPFALWARLRPSFGLEMQKAIEALKSKQNTAEGSAAIPEGDLEEMSEEESVESASDATEGEEDQPLQRLKRLEMRLRRHRHGLKKALRDGERRAAEILSFFGEPPPSRAQGSLVSLQDFLSNVSTFAKHFASAVKEVRAHHQRQRSDSLPRRLEGEEASRRFSRSNSTGALSARDGRARPEGPKTRALRRTKTRHLERGSEHPVLLNNQEIKQQLLAPHEGADPFKRGRAL